MSRDAATLAAIRNRIAAALKLQDVAGARAGLAQLRELYAGAQGPPRAMAAAFAELGDFSAMINDYPAAAQAYSRAVALQPDVSRYWFNRAAVRRFLGEMTLAEQDYDAALQRDPADGQAWLNRSDLRVQTPASNHLQELEAALATGPAHWKFTVPLQYALAKEYEDVGEYAKAWRHLQAGAQLRRQFLEYDPGVDLQTVNWLIEAFEEVQPSPSLSQQISASDLRVPQPIFIVGLPRTGSTLVDRILGSHSEVYSAGELTDFGTAVTDLAQKRLRQAPGATPQVSRRELIAACAHLDMAALGADYLRRVTARLPPGAIPCFTDKLPLNYLYCGLIARALPRARIVHVTRHPLAVCYAMYKVLFDQGYPFSYDLGEIADYYIAYRRLMSHWEQVLPGRIHQVVYERLVSEPYAEARALLAALDLAWQENCLRSHQNQTPVATASASQVRRPIYSSSVGLWRHYESQLQPLRSRLLAAGIAL